MPWGLWTVVWRRRWWLWWWESGCEEEEEEEEGEEEGGEGEADVACLVWRWRWWAEEGEELWENTCSTSVIFK